ncbi:hypothetical protein SIO70_23000 [Chitinophaga sancti]|uniref:hypothetical protein n=1 Tax=Chitinophaga sancti TaxID=1004 RepID=UPI002A766B39|nr:hypothetical protein [Chitinophaga sancti]WPQ61231.1 hypothetical protein SIO70_23000 [Chitinophaga sancti]
MSITIIIILSFSFVFILGFTKIFKRLRSLNTDYDFAYEFRNKFNEFANKYFEHADGIYQRGELDSTLYTWLMMNANKIQSILGRIGILHYIGPFQRYEVPNYQVVLNTLPKFRAGTIEAFDVHYTDDCLLRYLGSMENGIKKVQPSLKNPIIWLKQGFQELFSLPLYILNWFGILSDKSILKITANAFFVILTGFGGLIAFLSGVVTIIQGKDQTIELIRKIWPTFLQ